MSVALTRAPSFPGKTFKYRIGICRQITQTYFVVNFSYGLEPDIRQRRLSRADLGWNHRS